MNGHSTMRERGAVRDYSGIKRCGAVRKAALVFSVSVLLSGSLQQASAQKKPLDHSVYDTWESVAGQIISDDGQTLIYQVNPQEGDGKLYIRNLKDGRELIVDRGGAAAVSDDGDWAVFRIKARFKDTRTAKIKKKKAEDMPKDTLCYVNLRTFELRKIADAGEYKLNTKGRTVISYFSTPSKAAGAKVKDGAKAEVRAERKDVGKPESGRSKAKTKKRLVVLDPLSGRSDTLSNVEKYCFDQKGERLAVIFRKEKDDSLSRDEAVLFSYPSMERFTLSQDSSFYSTPEFSVDGSKLVMLASADTNKTGNKHCSVLLYEELWKGKGKKATVEKSVRRILPSDYTVSSSEAAEQKEGKPCVTESAKAADPCETESAIAADPCVTESRKNVRLCVTENSNPVFSEDARRVIIGVAEYQPAKDTSIVDFEAARVDIWSWDKYMTPPMQKARLQQLKSACCAAVLDLSAPDRLLLLTDSPDVRVSYADGAKSDVALLTDNRAYQISSTWDSNSFNDVYLASLKDGSRKLVAEKLNGRPSLSPTGKYLSWYSGDDLSWHIYDIASGIERNITAAAGVPFYDEEDDHPMTKPAVDRPHWIENDKSFIMSDKFDLWRFDPTGKNAPVCLTESYGRKNGLQMSFVQLRRNTIPQSLARLGAETQIGESEIITLKVFDRNTKENGFASVSVRKPGIKQIFTRPGTFPSVSKALNAEVTAYRKGDFLHSYDIYTTEDFFTSEYQWSHINPQQDSYLWGDMRLVHWKAYDGTPLDGLLVTPENLDTAAKCPMLIYFYEKNSETLYSYRTPAPSRSTVNIPFYASRGYVVFIPDIVYKEGHPGESGYNCICSGAEAMCEQFSFIDKSRMGIQGQSWGGYQTAYLVTRTDMFAAAGAGAPVGNMTSAYGGIRWESGMVRAMQYEHGQSRIGKSMWEEGGLDLYIENSPVFHTQNVTTPTLIMHNDADGAVPWYQGIEFFMALRRFHHPAWLLQYNDEAHNLKERRNCKDLSVRLQQFFDHYLKGEPMPAWMKDGVPLTRKGEYFGYEYAD